MARVESHTAKGAVEQKGERETRDRVCVLRENARRRKERKESERQGRQHACMRERRESECESNCCPVLSLPSLHCTFASSSHTRTPVSRTLTPSLVSLPHTSTVLLFSPPMQQQSMKKNSPASHVGAGVRAHRTQAARRTHSRNSCRQNRDSHADALTRTS